MSLQRNEQIFGLIKSYIENLKLFLQEKYKRKNINKEVFDYFNSFLDKRPKYFKNNIAIYLTSDYSKKLKDNGITLETLNQELGKNIKYAEKYKDSKTVNEIKLNINVLSDKVLKEKLMNRKHVISEIIKDKEILPKFLALLDNKISDPNDLFNLFTFDFDTIFKKVYSPYIFVLTEILNNNKLDNISNIDTMIEYNLFNRPVFNTSRDVIYNSDKSLEYFITNLHISPEYRLIKILLENKIINHNFKEKEIDYILSTYRCCVGGKSSDIFKIFINNSKYFNVFPFITDPDCEINDLAIQMCKIHPNFESEFIWSPLNNAIGFQLAAHNSLIFPYMFTSCILESRWDTNPFEIDKNIGVLILKIINEKPEKEYILINIKIKNGEIMFFDIYGNRVHLKDSPIGFQRMQLLESKWAINRLIWLLEHCQIIPYNKKECDIIVYKINKKIEDDKDLYLISLYSKSEIMKMYTNLRNALIVKISDPKLKEELDSLIQTFIDELNSYEEITKYRVYKNGKKFFIWEIDPSELSSWTDITMKKSKKGYNSNCISSELFIDMETGEEAFEKSDLTLNIDKNESILDYPDKKYFDAVQFHQNEKYAQYFKNQKALLESNKHSKSNILSTRPKLTLLPRTIKPYEKVIDETSRNRILEDISFKKYILYGESKAHHPNLDISFTKYLKYDSISERNRILEQIFFKKYLLYKNKYLKLKDIYFSHL